jgi:translocation and assembly module TamB
VRIPGPLRIAFWVVAFLAVLAGVTISVVRSEWFAESVRAEVVRRLTVAAGTPVEMRRFSFDWRALRVQIDGLVIHGREPVGVEPLLAIESTTVDLHIVSLLRRDIDVSGIVASMPRVHFVIFPDGSTNLPERAGSTSKGNQNLLALKVGHLVAGNGLLVADHEGGRRDSTPWNLRADNFHLRLNWEPAGPRYTLSLIASPLDWRMEGYPDFHAAIDAEAQIDRDAISLTHARLTQGHSQLVLADVRIAGLDNPNIAGRFQGRIAILDFAPRSARASGDVEVSGELHFASPDYRLAGKFKTANLQLDGVRGLNVSGDVVATPAGVDAPNLTAGLGKGVFRGRAELDTKKNIRISGKALGFSAKALAGALSLPSPPWDGIIGAQVEVRGLLGASAANSVRQASVRLTVDPAADGPAVHGEIAADWDGVKQRLDLGHSSLELPATRIAASGAVGERVLVTAETSNLADLAPLLNGYEAPFSLNNGVLAFAGDIVGPLANPRISGHAAVRNAIFRGYQIEAAQADLNASPKDVNVSGLTITALGLSGSGTLTATLTDWDLRPESAIAGTAEIARADLQKLLAAAHAPHVDASGTASVTARFAGTVADPRGEADLTLTAGLIEQQPYDTITAHLRYLSTGAQVLTANFASGPKRVTLSARRSEAVDTLPTGRINFDIASNSMALNQIALVRARQPDIGGAMEFKASGSVDITAGGELHVASLDASGNTRDIELNGRNFGNASFSLRGANDVMEARFDSDVAGAAVHGGGSVTLKGDFPASATITLADVDLNSVETLASRAGGPMPHQFEGKLQGEMSLRGPLRRFDDVTGTLDIPAFELRPAANTPVVRDIPGFTLKAAGPIHIALSKSIVHLDPVRLLAPSTELTVDGSLDISREPYVNLRLAGTANLALARNFVPDLTSSGSVVVDATFRGTQSAPLFSGRATVRDGAFRYAAFSNGLTGVTGEIVFNGPRATIQSLSGETGGGKVNASGFAALSGNTLAFRLDARAVNVRVRYPEGVSSVSDVSLTVAGTSDRSEASGSIVIHRLSVNPKADLASIISSSSGPQPSLSLTGLMANMNLDIQVATAPDVALESDVAQGLQADANLRLRGTAANPALLGRVNVSHGELSFFGNKYTITQGNVSFYNPARIEPVLNIDLSTQARGVEVILTVAGPPDKLNMSYRSDPPLEFSEIIGLLATGRTPTESTVGSSGAGSTAGFGQMGAGALLGQALASPVAGRLQRFFGVSRLKIDPQLTGVTGSPQARLTIEQQITPDILFTYVTDVAHTNDQLIRVEWAINRQVSAVLQREENGYVGLDFVWKKRLK